MIRKQIRWFILGAACFIVSQPLLRMPILYMLQRSTDFMLAYALNPIAIGIVIAFSAGLFEESSRFLFKRFLLKPDACGISQALIFGFGHGLAEALMILVPAMLSVPLSQLGLAFAERIMAILLHMNLSVIVFNGFQRNQRIRYLLLAILVHGLVNSMIPILMPIQNGVLLIEGILLGWVVILSVYSFFVEKNLHSWRRFQ